MKIATRLGALACSLLAIAISPGCQQQAAEPAPQVDLAPLKAALLAAWNDGDVDAYDAICAPGYVAHEVGSQLDVEGLEPVKEWTAAIRAAFPDIDFRIGDMFAAGDRVTAFWSWTGTHAGTLPASPAFPETPATGKVASPSGVAVFRIVDGKITEGWSYYDMATTLQQLGFTITPPAQSVE